MHSNAHTFDIVAFGPSFLDLKGEQIGCSLNNMLTFSKHVGGMASFAIACTRLGLKTALASALGQDDFGKFILQALKNEKIETSQIQCDDKTQTTIRFRAKHHQPATVGYPANNDCMPKADFSPLWLKSSKALLIASSNFSNKAWQQATLNLFTGANGPKLFLVLDEIKALDQNALAHILPMCSLIIGYEEDFQALYGQETQAALSYLRTLTDALLVVKNDEHCFIFSQQIPAQLQEATHFKSSSQRPWSVAKQAFMIGFIYGWLKDFSFEKCSEYANICLSLVLSREDDCLSLPCQEEVVLFSSSLQQVVQPSLTPLFEHVHYTCIRQVAQEQLFTFGFTPHQQWLKMAQMANVDETTMVKAKKLVALGIQQAAQRFPNIAILCDAKQEKEISDIMPKVHKLLRSFEICGEHSHQLQTDTDIVETLRQWPSHHCVNISFVYHPDDKYALRQQQEAALTHLYKVTRKLNHELCIELAPPANSLITASTYAHIMKRLYEIGIYPDWWQISSVRDQRSFEIMQRVIAENDRFCRGVLVLAPQATFDQLNLIFNNTAKQALCKGFIIGKSICQQELNLWFAQKINDEVLIDSVATNFEKAISIWLQAKETAPQVKFTEFA